MRDLLAERTQILTHARGIVDGCKAEGRADLTTHESEQVEDDLAQVKTLDAQIKGRNMVNAVLGRGRSGMDWGDGPSPTSMFDDEQRAGFTTALKSRGNYATEVSSKTLMTSTLLPPAGTAIEPGLHPTSQFPLASLFTEQPADGPIVRYYRMQAGTAALVSEGGLKGDAGIAVASVDLALEKIAATASVSTELQQDAGFLLQAVELELQAALLARENQLIVDTFGATSGVLTGTGTTANTVDLVAAAVASMEAFSGITPVGFIAHPSVIATVRQAKADSSGVYVVDPTAKAPQTLHGVPLYSSPATNPGTAWLVSGSGVVVYRRGRVMVALGFSNDDFDRNLNTMLGEERVGVAVTRPSSLYKLSLT